MSEPHVIRFREPWDREPLPSGGVRYRRNFNAPTGLTPTTQVTIVCEAPSAATTAWLNDRALGNHALEAGTWLHEITADLLSRNELMIEVAVGAVAAELPWREVRLEIREP
jgi:hypothetical protein